MKTRKEKQVEPDPPDEEELVVVGTITSPSGLTIPLRADPHSGRIRIPPQLGIKL